MAMGIFKGRSRGDDGVPAIAQPMAPALVATPSPSRRRSGRTASYSVRVAEGFKGEVLRLQAEIQLERQVENGRASKVTEGEVVMDKNFTLEADEVAQGYVLSCQARATTKRLKISFDER